MTEGINFSDIRSKPSTDPVKHRTVMDYMRVFKAYEDDLKSKKKIENRDIKINNIIDEVSSM